MNKQFLLFLSAIVVALCLAQCKQECTDSTNPDCPNYCPPVVSDPCAGAELTTAEFVMYQGLYPGTTQDTLIQFYHDCLWGKDITLHASQDSAEYHWIIGSDNYYTRDVTFEFGVSFVGQEIPLKLIVMRTPDAACYPNDNGIDTLVKTLMPKYYCDASIWGKYYGAWDESPLDSFVVELVPDMNDYPVCSGDIYLIGFNPFEPDTCSSWTNLGLDNYFRFLEPSTSTSCYDPRGFAKLDSTMNNILIDYSIGQTNTSTLPRVYHIFRGQRIN